MPSSVGSPLILLSRRLRASPFTDLLLPVVPASLPSLPPPLLRPPPPRRARLPTVLAIKTIFVTDNIPANFSLNHTPFTRPDLFSTLSLAGPPRPVLPRLLSLRRYPPTLVLFPCRQLH
ncbi:hypothetical protein V8G54_013286 [Vigna mungo]|uniref:Uncharacterized protein n=1 Tax=Vigna mungo TaxID=3915 RepID=A0AAQ3NT14_VIGMU